MKYIGRNFAGEFRTYMNIKPIGISGLVAAISALGAQGAIIKGTVTDRLSGEPLIGATVQAGKAGTATDIDGRYQISLPRGHHSLTVKYVGYNDTIIRNVTLNTDSLIQHITLRPDNQMLHEVTITVAARKDSEVAQIEEQKQSAVVQSGVSAQQIEKTQDKDASEVIRRIPGISIIDEKFVMVRGLSQRYNNVWLNGSAVPSSEADSRAFSFDIIPSSQLDNLVIIKSPAPEYPADFTGGFVLVNTRQQPLRTGFNIGLSGGVNDRTHFGAFLRANGHSPFPAQYLNHYDGHPGFINPQNNRFTNDWTTRSVTPLPDFKLSASYSGSLMSSNGSRGGLLAAVNYGNSHRTVLNMENSLYGPFDISHNREVPLRRATDNQYTTDHRLGAMLNTWLRPADSGSSFEWKSVFNLITKNRYSERVGFNAQGDNLNDMEYYYSSRPTFNTQVTGKHNFDSNYLDWSAGYAFAQRNLPDRRLIQRTDRTDQTMGIYRISREFTRLNEHIGSLNANYQRQGHRATFKAGAYGELRTRTYTTRQFQYGWQPNNNLPAGFLFNPNVQSEVLTAENYGPDKLYLYEEVNFLNNYSGNQAQAGSYASINIPLGKLAVYAGVRYEFCRQVLNMNTRQYEQSMQSTTYNYSDFFPSINAVYHLNNSQQLRLAYGRSTNRPEFRELSSSVFYDFDLGSSVMGNADLKAAYIDNLDLRYELYPSKGEQVTLAAFYKRFQNPIEWTYTVAGGTDLIYSFVNAPRADNFGLELDIRKSLDCIGLPDFSLSFNGSLISSQVRFDAGSNNIDRPMQGQSPYLINTGIFYGNSKGWSAALLYNCIGRRIVGVGNRYGTAADGSARNIPNSYEMPRHAIDLSAGKKWGKFSVKLALRDLLAQRYEFRQIEAITLPNGQEKQIQEVTRSYRPGRNFNLSLSYDF